MNAFSRTALSANTSAGVPSRIMFPSAMTTTRFDHLATTCMLCVKNEIAGNFAMRRVTFFKYWKELEKVEALKETRKIGGSTRYELDTQNEVVKQLIKLDMALARKPMQRAIKGYEKPIAARSRR